LTRRRRGLQQVLEGTVSVGAEEQDSPGHHLVRGDPGVSDARGTESFSVLEDIDRHIDRRGRLQDWGYWWLRGRGHVAKNERNSAE